MDIVPALIAHSQAAHAVQERQLSLDPLMCGRHRSRDRSIFDRGTLPC